MKRRQIYLSAATLAAFALLLAAALWWIPIPQPEGDVGRSPAQKVYVVQAINWEFRSRGDPFVVAEGQPGFPEKVFLDHDRASAHCRDLNRQSQAKENPFAYRPEGTYGSYLDQYCTMGETAFLDFLRSEGLPPPIRKANPNEYEGNPWLEWWSEHRPGWDEQLVERMWKAIDHVRFYRVMEVAVEP